MCRPGIDEQRVISGASKYNRRLTEAIRTKEEIPLLKPRIDDLLEISEKTGIPFEIGRAT